jgi:hypothetical protein
LHRGIYSYTFLYRETTFIKHNGNIYFNKNTTKKNQNVYSKRIYFFKNVIQKALYLEALFPSGLRHQFNNYEKILKEIDAASNRISLFVEFDMKPIKGGTATTSGFLKKPPAEGI